MKYVQQIGFLGNFFGIMKKMVIGQLNFHGHCINNYTGPKHNTHELDRSTIWQRMWKLRMQQRTTRWDVFSMFF